MNWDNERMHINIADMRSFLPDTVNACNYLAEAQNTIAQAYESIKEEWRDAVCYEVGETLAGTESHMRALLADWTSLVNDVYNLCNCRAEYAGLDPVTMGNINDISSFIRTDPSMQNENIETTRESLNKFADSLDNYLNDIVTTINTLDRLYQDIGHSWRDAQYTAYGEELRELCRIMQQQIDDIDNLPEDIRHKAEHLTR